MIKLKDIFLEYGIDLTAEMVDKFEQYYKLIIEHNNYINLTAITEYNEVVIKHFLDSTLPYNEIKKNSYIIDVGTGAGFPAIPLKIIRPDLKFLLVDSLNKRVLFLEQVIKELNLKNIECIHGRSEDLARNEKYRESFDFCVSRAVAKLNTLSELCLPFLKNNGTMLAYKGLNVEDEINLCENSLNKLNSHIEKILNYKLPNGFGCRNIVVIKKDKKISNIYPRKNNLPKNKPL